MGKKSKEAVPAIEAPAIDAAVERYRQASRQLQEARERFQAAYAGDKSGHQVDMLTRAVALESKVALLDAEHAEREAEAELVHQVDVMHLASVLEQLQEGATRLTQLRNELAELELSTRGAIEVAMREHRTRYTEHGIRSFGFPVRNVGGALDLSVLGIVAAIEERVSNGPVVPPIERQRALLQKEATALRADIARAVEAQHQADRRAKEYDRQQAKEAAEDAERKRAQLREEQKRFDAAAAEEQRLARLGRDVSSFEPGTVTNGAEVIREYARRTGRLSGSDHF